MMVRMDANESPWGPSARAVRALDRARLDRYPEAGPLEDALAHTLGVSADRVVLGNGSTELIGLLVLTWCGPDGAVATTDGSFVAYRQLAEAAGRRLQLARPRPGGGVDLDALAAVVDAHTQLVFVANPDNPSGTTLSREDLARFLARLPQPGPLVVLDEAYREYVRDPAYPATAAFFDDPRVVVLRTFSKVHGLAGLRVGWLAAHPDVAARVRAVGGPFRVGRASRAAALEALGDAAHIGSVVAGTLRARDGLRNALLERGFHVPPSEASFLMVSLGQAAAPVCTRLARAGIVVRDLEPYGWPDAIRVTVGQEAENHAFVEALARVGDRFRPAFPLR